MKHDEYALQCDVVKYLRDKGFVVFSVPNERNQGISDSRRMRASGLTKGIPDLICLSHNARCIFLELKTPKGSRSIEQEAVASALQRLGFEYRLVRSIDDVSDLTI